MRTPPRRPKAKLRSASNAHAPLRGPSCAAQFLIRDLPGYEPVAATGSRYTNSSYSGSWSYTGSSYSGSSRSTKGGSQGGPGESPHDNEGTTWKASRPKLEGDDGARSSGGDTLGAGAESDEPNGRGPLPQVMIQMIHRHESGEEGRTP